MSCERKSESILLPIEIRVLKEHLDTFTRNVSDFSVGPDTYGVKLSVAQ